MPRWSDPHRRGLPAAAKNLPSEAAGHHQFNGDLMGFNGDLIDIPSGYVIA